MLTHLEASDLVKLTELFNSKLAVVQEMKLNCSLQFSSLNALIGVLKLLSRDGHSSAFDVEVLSNVDEPRAPAASEIQNIIAVLHV